MSTLLPSPVDQSKEARTRRLRELYDAVVQVQAGHSDLGDVILEVVRPALDEFAVDLLQRITEIESQHVEPIRIWPWHRAPVEFRYSHGGDEDYVAHVPASWNGDYPMFLESGSSFGYCHVSVHPQDDGSLVLVGAHA